MESCVLITRMLGKGNHPWFALWSWGEAESLPGGDGAGQGQELNSTVLVGP